MKELEGGEGERMHTALSLQCSISLSQQLDKRSF